MKRLGVDVGFAQLVGHYFGGVFGGDEDQHAWPFFGLNQMAKQLGAAWGVDGYGALGDVWLGFWLGLYLNAQWVVQQAAG